MPLQNLLEKTKEMEESAKETLDTINKESQSSSDNTSNTSNFIATIRNKGLFTTKKKKSKNNQTPVSEIFQTTQENNELEAAKQRFEDAIAEFRKSVLAYINTPQLSAESKMNGLDELYFGLLNNGAKDYKNAISSAQTTQQFSEETIEEANNTLTHHLKGVSQMLQTARNKAQNPDANTQLNQIANEAEKLAKATQENPFKKLGK